MALEPGVSWRPEHLRGIVNGGGKGRENIVLGGRRKWDSKNELPEPLAECAPQEPGGGKSTS